MCALVVWRELRAVPGDDRKALVLLVGSAAPFVAGVALPVVLLVTPYVATGSLGDLFAGLVRDTPRASRREGLLRVFRPVALVFAVPVVLVLFAIRSKSRTARSVDIGAAAVLAALLLVSIAVADYMTIWWMTTALLPVGVFVGVVLLGRDETSGLDTVRMPLYLLLALSAFLGLVQFPYAAPVYFCFVAPLAVLAWLAMFRHPSLRGSVIRVFPVLVLATTVAFGFVLNHGVLYRDGLRLRANPRNGSSTPPGPGSASDRPTRPCTPGRRRSSMRTRAGATSSPAPIRLRSTR